MVRMSRIAGYDGLVRRARHILERVSEQTGETADLAVAGQHGVTYVGEVAPPSVLAINWLAREVPLHATSTGKAFLAWLPPEEARGLLDLPLPRFTDTTVTDPETPDASSRDPRTGVRRVRRRARAGAVRRVRTDAQPRTSRPFGVFSIWGPVSRVPAVPVRRARTVAVEAAEEVREALLADR